jgi:hypothetical protein
MSEEPENHTLRMLREMREENAAFRTETSARFEAVDGRFDAMRAENLRQHAETRAQFASVLETVADIAKAVNTVH